MLKGGDFVRLADMTVVLGGAVVVAIDIGCMRTVYTCMKTRRLRYASIIWGWQASRRLVLRLQFAASLGFTFHATRRTSLEPEPEPDLTAIPSLSRRSNFHH